MKNLY